MKEKVQYLLIIIIMVVSVLFCMFGLGAILESSTNLSLETVQRFEVAGGFVGLVVGYCICKVFFGKEQ